MTKTVSTVAAVENELRELARREPSVMGSWLASLAVQLAREVDRAQDSAAATAAKVACARELRETMAALYELVPADASDGLDDLGARRAQRLARVSA